MSLHVNYGWYVSRLQQEGAFHIDTQGLPAELGDFRRELRRAAKAAGVRVHTSDRGHTFFAWDPDYEVPEEQLRAVMDAMAAEAPAIAPWCPSCRGVTRRSGTAWHCDACDLTVMGGGHLGIDRGRGARTAAVSAP